MFYCPNCGGKVVFDIPTQQMKCVYCGTQTPPEQYDADNTVQESTYETNVYICRNCGAQLTSPDEQMVSFCSYCGSEAVLAGKAQSENRPKEIIPFRIAKKRCQELYRTKVAKSLFLPKELKDEQFLEQFRGIYIPYWSIQVDFPQPAVTAAYTETPIGGSRYQHNTYLLQASAAHDKARYERDGSSSLDDTIAEAIGDFSGKTEPFRSAYLAGFYADRADVAPEKYVQDVQEEARDDAGSALKTQLARHSMYATSAISNTLLQRVGFNPQVTPIAKNPQQAFQPVCRDYFGKLLPVWFLTWRKKDRVSYIVMNGETGSMYTELPVDKSKYLLMAGIISLVLFALFSLFLTVVAPSTMGISALLAGINLTVLVRELRKLMEKELHVNDIGSKEYDPSLAKYSRKRKIAKGAGFGSGCLVTIAIVLYFAMDVIGFDEIFSNASQYTLMGLTTVLAVPLALIGLINGIRYTSKLKEKSMLIWPLINALCILAEAVIALIRPVDDWYYYVGAMICMAGSLIPALKLIDVYNLMATRPLPSFFGREGANHGINE